jgi:hypothetical protein
MQDTPREPNHEMNTEGQGSPDTARPSTESSTPAAAPGGPSVEAPPPQEPPPSQHTSLPQTTDTDVSERRRWVAGIVLIILGLFFLAQQFFGDFWSWAKWWPLILIVIGLFILVRSRHS